VARSYGVPLSTKDFAKEAKKNTQNVTLYFAINFLMLILVSTVLILSSTLILLAG